MYPCIYNPTDDVIKDSLGSKLNKRQIKTYNLSHLVILVNHHLHQFLKIVIFKSKTIFDQKQIWDKKQDLIENRPGPSDS